MKNNKYYHNFKNDEFVDKFIFKKKHKDTL